MRFEEKISMEKQKKKKQKSRKEKEQKSRRERKQKRKEAEAEEQKRATPHPLKKASKIPRLDFPYFFPPGASSSPRDASPFFRMHPTFFG